jgi:RNA polymerase sigma factor (sigma-70 family)
VTVKEQLRGYRSLCKTIKSLEEEVDRLYLQATLPSVQGDAVRVQSTKAKDPIADVVAEYIDAMGTLKPLLESRIYQREQIEAMIDKLNQREQRLIRLRYIEGKTFEEIAVDMCYSWKQVHRIHGETLQKMSENVLFDL